MTSQQLLLASKESEGDSFSFAHTTSGANRAVLVGYGIASDDLVVTAVTYGGVPMTLVASNDPATPGSYKVEAWALSAPAVGANDVEIFTTGVDLGAFIAGAISFTGANQVTAALTGTPAYDDDSNGDGTNPGADAPSAVGEIVVDFVHRNNGGGPAAVGAGQTERIKRGEDEGDSGLTSRNFYASTEPGAAGTVDMSWTGMDDELGWAQLAISVKPEVASLALDAVTNHIFF